MQQTAKKNLETLKLFSGKQQAQLTQQTFMIVSQCPCLK